MTTLIVMNRYIHAVAWLFILASPLASSAQGISEALERLSSPEDSERVEAFYDLIGDLTPRAGDAVLALVERRPGERDAIAVALIDLLERETGHLYFPETGVLQTGSDGYFGDLIWAVAVLNDVRSVDALVEVIGSGSLARDGIIAIGEPALPAILRGLDRADSDREMSSIMALAEMSKLYQLNNPASPHHDPVRTHLLRATEAENPHLRIIAAEALSEFRHPDVETAMRALARSDSATRQVNGRTVYPVREVAKQWLERHGSSRR
jgi:hypothetical protein